MDKHYKLNRLTGGLLILFSGLILCLHTSCSREMTSELAMEQIMEQDEFKAPYYAPMRVGEMVLTGDNHTKYKEYVRKNYGSLIDASLVEVNTDNRNSWRTVIDVQLTSKGRDMSDERRATQKEAYVQVCRMVPVTMDEFQTLSEGNIIECTYSFQEDEITPFGVYKGFQEGRKYKDSRTFVRARGSWRLK